MIVPEKLGSTVELVLLSHYTVRLPVVSSIFSNNKSFRRKIHFNCGVTNLSSTREKILQEVTSMLDFACISKNTRNNTRQYTNLSFHVTFQIYISVSRFFSCQHIDKCTLKKKTFASSKTLSRVSKHLPAYTSFVVNVLLSVYPFMIANAPDPIPTF